MRECFNPVNSSNKRQRKTNLFNDTILDNFESEKVREGQGFLTQKRTLITVLFGMTQILQYLGRKFFLIFSLLQEFFVFFEIGVPCHVLT